MHTFTGPMQPWPTLAEYGQNIKLSESGINLFFYDSGPSDKPPLVLIHGSGDDADTWRHVFAPLAARYRVVALDLPGFGRSDKPRRIYSLTFLRDIVLELMDALSLSAATLIGNSLGAMIAEAVAIKRTERVAGMVLVDGSLTTHVFSYHKSLMLMALPILGRRMYDSLHGQPQAAFDSLRLFYASLDNLQAADRQFLYQRVNERLWDDKQRDALLSILRQLILRLPLHRHYFAACLSRLGMPKQIIWGERDAVNPVETARALEAILPGAKLTVIPDVGHLPQQEAPDAFLDALLGMGMVH